MRRPNQPESSELDNILKVAERLDNELKELPLESHAAIVNILSQLTEHRASMLQREERKKAEQRQREAQFAPHLAGKPS
jgi:hypothetical protein